MSEFKGERGKWEVFKPDHTGCTSVSLGKHTGFEGYVEIWHHHFNNKEEANFTAELIAEAGNIRQQIPFSLTELKRQRDELLEALKLAVKAVKVFNKRVPTEMAEKMISDWEQLLESVTEIK